MQVTIAERHATTGMHAAMFLDNIVKTAHKSGCVCALVFVIPAKQFFKNHKFSWKHQTILASAKEACKLVQFAMCPEMSKS